MLDLLTIFALFCLASCLATSLLRKFLLRKGVLDTPNERSSHTIPTPRGGGIALMAVLLTGWVGYGLSAPEVLPGFWQIILGSLALMAVSWLDDVKNLSAKTRLVIQIFAVALGFWGLNRAGLSVQLFPGYLPLWLDHLILGLAWIWLINLYNFMDGIDGISGIQTISITLGLIILAWQLPLPQGFQFLPLIIMASTTGFLIWNWEPASIFLGDVGSVPLGYILGWFFLLLISQGLWAAALILPLYYLCDATFTLIKRLLKKQKIWQAHREHCYQWAVRNGASHKQVVLVILGCNIGLLGIAVWFSQNHPWLSLTFALMLVSLTMIVLLRKQGLKASGKQKP
ncbi:glycosyltransferase family 4 protein [Kiloniella laminariae]|uniref:Glycosyltransferase family 4 protein n=1 Tax=Kiloniella laminariae TaxID=454162 RepID=A0ABT4LMB5_9PROT|nr:glycosyltransferase family 4 protein [Kiloniella laminariae]MCZ4281112.1 glycosyltransferase family 4 protein [Kiloniella laminariae]